MDLPQSSTDEGQAVGQRPVEIRSELMERNLYSDVVPWGTKFRTGCSGTKLRAACRECDCERRTAAMQ